MAQAYRIGVARANMRSVPSTAEGRDTVLASLDRNTTVTPTRAVSWDDMWLRVRVEDGPHQGMTGFIRRWLLAGLYDDPSGQVFQGDRRALNDVFWYGSLEFDFVRYGFGVKSRSFDELRNYGSIDCSGWMFILFFEAFSAVNRAMRGPVFATDDTRKLNDMSNNQVARVADVAGVLISGTDILTVPLQPGMLFGQHFGTYDWDRGRTLEIDHVTASVADPSSGRLFMTQSSSGGGGVNLVPMDDWIEDHRRLFDGNRIHMTDPLLMGDFDPPDARRYGGLESGESGLPLLDVAGVPGS